MSQPRFWLLFALWAITALAYAFDSNLQLKRIQALEEEAIAVLNDATSAKVSANQAHQKVEGLKQEYARDLDYISQRFENLDKMNSKQDLAIQRLHRGRF